LAVPSVGVTEEYLERTEIVTAFMEAFLPGPITVVAEKTDRVPDALTGGRNRVGIRIPDHAIALDLLNRVSPITATSANVSGSESVTTVDQLSPQITDGVAVVIDGGETPGLESTVVDPSLGTIHRRGALADEVADWLRAHDR
jgi:L-threonylcarbamoyladenylate synthase